MSQKLTTYNSVAAQAILLKLFLSNRKGVTCSWVDEITPKCWVIVCSQSFEWFCESGKSYMMYYTWITYHDEQIADQNYMYIKKTHLLSLLYICSVGVMDWVRSNGSFYEKLYYQLFSSSHLWKLNNVCSAWRPSHAKKISFRWSVTELVSQYTLVAWTRITRVY